MKTKEKMNMRQRSMKAELSILITQSLRNELSYLYDKEGYSNIYPSFSVFLEELIHVGLEHKIYIHDKCEEAL